MKETENCTCRSETDDVKKMADKIETSKKKDDSKSAGPKTNPEKLDSGWAWVVLLGGFILQFTVLGFIASVSVYVYVWMEYFDGSAAETSLVISICSFMLGVLSPLAGSMCTRYGPRSAAMLGGVVASLGMLISSQSTDILFLIITLGFFTAFGMSMCVNSTFAALGKYFNKRLTVAFGIASAGVSIGQLVFPPLYTYLIDQYGWRGSLVIVAAISLHAVPAGALFRPLKSKKQKTTPTKTRQSEKKLEDVQNEVKAPNDEGPAKDFEKAKTFERGVSFCNPSVFGRDNFTLYPHRSTSLADGSIFEADSGVVSMTTMDDTEDTSMTESMESESSEGDFPIIENNYWNPFILTAIENPNNDQIREREDSNIRPLLFSAFFFNLVKEKSREVTHFIIKSSKLLRNPSFVIMLFVAVSHGFGWASTTYHLVSRAESVGIKSTQSALLLTLMGGGSSIGRINIGWIVDKGFLRPEIGYFISLTICAAATFVTPLLTVFGILAFVAVIHGISSGAASVTIMLLPRIVAAKPSQITTVTALLLFAWGVGEITGGALAGWFYDVLGSYDYSFYSAGSLMVTGASLVIVIYLLQQVKKKRQQRAIEAEGENVEEFEFGLNQFHADDRGRVNPIFFMREECELENESYHEIEGMGGTIRNQETEGVESERICERSQHQRNSTREDDIIKRQLDECNNVKDCNNGNKSDVQVYTEDDSPIANSDIGSCLEDNIDKNKDVTGNEYKTDQENENSFDTSTMAPHFDIDDDCPSIKHHDELKSNCACTQISSFDGKTASSEISASEPVSDNEENGEESGITNPVYFVPCQEWSVDETQTEGYNGDNESISSSENEDTFGVSNPGYIDDTGQSDEQEITYL